MKQPIAQLQLWLTGTLIATLIWLTSTGAKAYVQKKPKNPDLPMAEYEATYDIKFHGIKAGESTHRLHQREDGVYHFSTRTDPVLDFIPYHYYESTDFRYKDGKIIPQNYYYDLKEGRRHKKGNVAFDWVSKVVANKVSPNPWKKTATENLQDKLTQAINLRFDLIQGNTDLSYKVAEDDEIKPYSFRILGEEQVETPIGTFMAIKVEHVHRKGHRTNTWFAKNLNYFPIKINQIRKGRVVGQGEITQLNQIPVSDNPTKG